MPAEGTGFATLTDGTDAELGSPPEVTLAMDPRRCSMSAFCCSFSEIIERTCSSAAGSLCLNEYPTMGETLLSLSPLSSRGPPAAPLAPVGGGGRTSVLMGWEMPLMVTRLFLVGEGCAALVVDEGGDAVGSVAADGSWCCCPDRT